MPLVEPTIVRDEDEFIFTWPLASDELGHLAVAVTNLRDTSGDTYGEVHAEWRGATGHGRLFGNRKANLIGVRTVDDLAKLLTSKHETAFPLDLTKLVFEQVIDRTLAQWRAGEPLQWVHMAEEVGDVAYAIDRIVPEDDNAVTYGQGDSKKGWVAIHAALCWATSQPLAGEIGVNNRGNDRALYLDWEASERESFRRFQWMARGMGLPGVPKGIAYLRMTRPIADTIGEIRRTIKREHIGFVVIDSLGPASGSKLVADDTALAAMNAVRRLSPASRLIIAHISKGERRGANGADSSIFGSVFFDNMARSTWKIATDTISADEYHIGMFHTKVNTGRKSPGIGFTLSFHDNVRTVCIGPSSIDDHSQSLGALNGSVRERMIKALSHQGLMTRLELAELIGATSHDIRQALYSERHKPEPAFKEWDDKKIGMLAKEGYEPF